MFMQEIGDELYLREFNASPPKYPLIDFPLSLILDNAILSVADPVASYELLIKP